jgi:ATP-binding cassette, subfamily B, bacterial HlyB/CyaB
MVVHSQGDTRRQADRADGGASDGADAERHDRRERRAVGGATRKSNENRRPVDTLFMALMRLAREFDRPVSEADIRAACPVPETGMTVNAFIQAARRLGYRVKRVPFSARGAAQLPTPFVILGGADAGAQVALNRQDGLLTVSSALSRGETTATFDEAAGGASEALLVTPEKATGPNPTWHGMISSRIKSVAKELIAASLLINLFALGSPLFVMTIYNKVIGQRALDTLWVLAIGMVMLFAFDMLLRGIRGYISSHTGARMDSLLGGEVVHRLIHLPYRHFETTSTGLISERLRQLETIRQFFTGQMPMVLVDLAFVFVFVAVLYFLSPVLAQIVIGAIPVFLIISLAFNRAQKKLVEQNFVALAAKTSALAEAVSNALTIKSLGLESEIEKRWTDRLALSAWTGFRSNNLANLISTFGSALQQFVGLVIIFVGALSVIDGQMSIGALIAANILASRAVAPMRQVVTAWSQLHEVRSAFSRLNEIMDQPTEARPGTLLPAAVINGEITLENVGFSYDPELAPALRKVNLTIEAGSIVSIIGPSGSGKSTLAKLILGLYAPEAGRVLIDGTDIAHISPHSLRRQIGVVPQEIQLFAGTVRDNICMGMPGLGHERLASVAKFVGAHDFIQLLPKGYDTVLGERGGGLSAGQRQLICITRALLRNPRILILDEPTSALDSVSEEQLLRNLHRLARTRTIFIISHRLAPASISDKIAMLVDGEIVAVGPPSEIATMTRAHMTHRKAPGPTGEPASEPDTVSPAARIDDRLRRAFDTEGRDERIA